MLFEISKICLLVLILLAIIDIWMLLNRKL